MSSGEARGLAGSRVLSSRSPQPGGGTAHGSLRTISPASPVRRGPRQRPPRWSTRVRTVSPHARGGDSSRFRPSREYAACWICSTPRLLHNPGRSVTCEIQAPGPLFTHEPPNGYLFTEKDVSPGTVRTCFRRWPMGSPEAGVTSLFPRLAKFASSCRRPRGEFRGARTAASRRHGVLSTPGRRPPLEGRHYDGRFASVWAACRSASSSACPASTPDRMVRATRSSSARCGLVSE